MPYFSIIIPTYNRSSFILKTIKSLLDQTYRNFEIIVVDDGSIDNTEEVVNSVSDNRVKYYKKENEERGIARNFGTSLATGEYCNFFDSDDLAYPNHLQEAYEYIHSFKSAPEIFHLGYDMKKPEGELIGKFSIDQVTANKKLIRENFLSCNGVFIRKDICKKFPFPEDRKMAASEDWALWLVLAARYHIWCKNVVTSTIVFHDQRSIFDLNPDKIIERDTLLTKYLLSDEEFINYYKNNLSQFKSDRYTFYSLLLSMKKRKKETLHYLNKAIRSDLKVVIRKRFLTSLKKIIIGK